MGQESFFNMQDTQATWNELRSSRIFPAIVGGLAGAAIGVAVMFVVNRRSQPKKKLPAAYDAEGNPMNVVYLPAPKQPQVLGFTLGDLIGLGMTGMTLFRQIQAMRGGNEEEDHGKEANGFGKSSQGEKPKTSHKK